MRGVQKKEKEYLTLSAAIPEHFSENGVRRESEVPEKDFTSHIRLFERLSQLKHKRIR